MSLLTKIIPTYCNVLQAVEEALADAGVEEARRTAEWLLTEVVDESRAHLHAHSERILSGEELAVLEEMLERRLQGEPLQYILGYTEFYGLRLRVSPAVLIPRPETERVVEYLLQTIETVERPRVMDIGTGSGCIGLAVAHERPDAEVIACDESERALEVARRNARDLGLSVEFQYADVERADFMDGASEVFDAVVSNPPYVAPEEREFLQPEVRDHEPGAALFTPDDPLHFYHIIANRSLRLLKPGGWLVFETHADYGSAIAALLDYQGYEQVELHADWAKRPRVALGRKPDIVGFSAPSSES